MTRVAPKSGERVEATTRGKVSTRRCAIVIASQNGRCRICCDRLSTFEIDHIIPLWLGGDDIDDNCQALCIPCHRYKTKADKRAIAHAKRLIRKSDPATRKAPTMKSRKTVWPSRKMQSRPFR